jgi:hypothetical protein
MFMSARDQRAARRNQLRAVMADPPQPDASASPSAPRDANEPDKAQLEAAADTLRHLPVNALVAFFQSMMPQPAQTPAPVASLAMPNNAIKLPVFRGESTDDKDPLPQPADVVGFTKRVDAFFPCISEHVNN